MKSLKISLIFIFALIANSSKAIPSPLFLAPHYDSIIFVKANPLYNKDFYWPIKDGKWGMLNADKKEIVPCVYDIPYVESEYYSRSMGEGCEFQVTNPVIMLKDSFAELVDLEKGAISPSSTEFLRKIDSHFVFRLANKKYGVLNSLGKL